jgi:hypothetical protein
MVIATTTETGGDSELLLKIRLGSSRLDLQLPQGLDNHVFQFDLAHGLWLLSDSDQTYCVEIPVTTKYLELFESVEDAQLLLSRYIMSQVENIWTPTPVPDEIIAVIQGLIDRSSDDWAYVSVISFVSIDGAIFRFTPRSFRFTDGDRRHTTSFLDLGAGLNLKREPGGQCELVVNENQWHVIQGPGLMAMMARLIGPGTTPCMIAPGVTRKIQELIDVAQAAP